MKLDFLMCLINVKFVKHWLFLWTTDVRHLSSAAHWRSIAFCRTAWTGQPQYVLWWWIATVKYKHLTHHPFYSQIHQLTETTWDHQICAFNCQAGHQTSDVIRCRRFHPICSRYISHPDPNWFLIDSMLVLQSWLFSALWRGLYINAGVQW